MPQIKRLADSAVFTVAAYPTWLHGMWECGDQRFEDPAENLYQAVGSAPYPLLTPMQFYLAFTPAERIAIKGSTDKMVMEFWATYELAVTTNDTINPNLTSVQGGLTYISAVNQSPAPAAAWATSTAVTVGQQRAVGTNVYTCTTPGTTASSGTGPSGTGTGITDGSAVWSYTATPYIAPSRVASILAGVAQ